MFNILSMAKTFLTASLAALLTGHHHQDSQNSLPVLHQNSTSAPYFSRTKALLSRSSPTSLISPLIEQFPHLSNYCGLNLHEISTNQSARADDDEKRTTCEIVTARGFRCQVHYVTTNGGFIVQLHQILLPENSTAQEKRRFPVILQTGLIGTSADFVMASSDVTLDPQVMGQNMGFELVKRGFDVFLSNNRGNQYALNHTTLSPNDRAFWRWTFGDIASQDTPAIVDYVLNVTSASKVHFVGHSQGTAVMFALLSTKPETVQEKLASFVAISPITRIGNAKTSFRYLIKLLTPLLLLDGAIFTPLPLQEEALSLACNTIGSEEICKYVFFSVVGPSCGQLDMNRLPVYLTHMPSSTSRRNLRHFKELFATNRFKEYDTDQDYPLSQISLNPMYIIYAHNDWFVPLDGVEALRSDLPNGTTFHKLSDPSANHMDPLVGLTAAVETNTQVLKYLQENDA